MMTEHLTPKIFKPDSSSIPDVFEKQRLRIATTGPRDSLEKSFVTTFSGVNVLFGFTKNSISTTQLVKNGWINAKCKWMECRFKDIGTLYFPVNDNVFFKTAKFSPDKYIDTFLTGVNKKNKDVFLELISDVVAQFTSLLELDMLTQVNLVAEPTFCEDACVFSLDSASHEIQLQGYASRNTLNSFWRYARTKDKRWVDRLQYIESVCRRTLTVSIASKPLQGSDLEMLAPGAIIELESVTSDEGQTHLFASASLDRWKVICGFDCINDGQINLQCLKRVEYMNDHLESIESLEDDATEKIVFEIGQVELSIAEIAQLSPGEMISLGSNKLPYVSMRLNNQLIGRGELVVWKDHVAIQVIDLLRDE